MEPEPQPQPGPGSEVEPETPLHWVYWCGIPVLCAVCTVSVAVNARVLWLARLVRRPMSATLRISLSLAAADATASTLLCAGLLANSYLRKVWRVVVPECACLAMEALRVGAILITVLHLLALACNHHVGIARPLQYARIVTRRHVCAGLTALWLLPPAYFLAYFALVPGDGFAHPQCSSRFVEGLQYRAMFVSLLLVPLLAMCVIYAHILVIVRMHRRLWPARHHQRQAMARNVRALHTTLLILGSFAAGLLPATGALLLCCEQCVFARCPSALIWLVNLLVIVKTLANPVIYAARMAEIKEAAARHPAASPRALADSSWRSSARSVICRLTSNGTSSPQHHTTTAL